MADESEDQKAYWKKRRGRNIAIALALFAWVLIVYIAIMVKVHNEIRP